MHPFNWLEIANYFFPVIAIVVMLRFFRHRLEFLEQRYLIFFGTLLMPLWLVMINRLGWLIYDFNIIPWWSYAIIIVLWLHLYDYVRVVLAFNYAPYFRAVQKIIFLTSSSLLVGLLITRLISYFF